MLKFVFIRGKNINKKSLIFLEKRAVSGIIPNVFRQHTFAETRKPYGTACLELVEGPFQNN